MFILKKNALRRIMVASIALVIVSILYLFPNNNNLEIKQSVSYQDVNTSPIYLLNEENYVIRTNIIIKEVDSINKARELIEALTIGSEKSDYIPKNFQQIIPKNTKLLNISLDNNILKINFSKDFLNVLKNDEEKMIEALVFTLTEDENILGIMLFVEDNKLETLPQSKIKLPNVIDRSFGINKVYDITSLKDINKTTIYYIAKNDDLTYYIPVTKIDNNQNDKVEIIINELKSSHTYNANLMSYLASSVELLSYEALENQINLSFNNAIFDDFNEKTILEEVKYSIYYSIQDTMNVKQVTFIVDNEVIS